MYMAYCPNCKKETGYKRSLGIGTLFAVILTGGLWLIAILFYPTRCVVCGGSKTATRPKPEGPGANKAKEAKVVKNSDEYQSWVEEFIYKFDKAVTKISSNPGNPIDDYDVLASFFATIKEKALDTSRIKGLENKSAFDQTLLKSEELFNQLERVPEVQNNLGCMYNDGHGARQDSAEAVKWFRLAADQGNSNAQSNLGTMYDNGQGVKQDYSEAMKWYRLAADQGNKYAQSNLGNMYDNGRGVKQDYSEAMKWFQKAADQGLTGAQTYIGIMYIEGKGIPKDPTAAIKWCRKAADQGLARAQYNIGVVYEKGEDVSEDFVEAMKWYKKAAAQGYADAQYKIGLMHWDGLKVAQDRREARRWFQKAANQGHQKAKEMLQKLK